MHLKCKVLLGASMVAVSVLAMPFAHGADVDNRLNNDSARINNAEATGQMSTLEAKRLHAHQRHLQHQARRMRWRSGGHLTPRQQAKLERKEMRLEHNLHHHKHGAAFIYRH